MNTFLSIMKKHALPSGIFLFIALLIAFPVLVSKGQIFLLDMIFPPVFSFSDVGKMWAGSSLPASFLLYLVSLVSSIGVAEKLLMMLVLLLPMFAMYALLMQKTARTYATLGGILFLINPFMYDRFVAGHWFVMLGVAYIPVVLMCLERACARPSYRHTALFAIICGIFPFISLHFAYIGAGIVCAYLAVNYGSLKLCKETKVILRHVGLFVVIVLLINSFWIGSFLAPGSAFREIDHRDFGTFVTQGDPTVGVYLNVLTLNGFWREGGVLVKDLLLLWWLPSLLIFLLVLLGVRRELNHHDKVLRTLLFVSPLVLLLSVGYATEFTRIVTAFVASILPGFTGLRETGKFIGLFAFLYAYSAPVGLEVLLNSAFPVSRRAKYIGGSMLVLCAFATAFPFFWGAMGQVRTTEYPESWKVVDEKLRGASHGTVLVFPWRGYLEVSFAHNLFIANPAPAYFSFPVETSVGINNVIYDQKYTTQFDQYIPLDVSDTEVANDMAHLRTLGVTHIMLLKTSDWDRYLPLLNDERYFAPVLDENEIALYLLK